MKTKQCARCGSRRLLKFFNRDKQRPDGYRVYCVFCIHKGRRGKYRKRYNNRDLPPGVKYCAECGEIKPLGAFRSVERGSRGRTSYCHVCENSRERERYRKKREGLSLHGKWLLNRHQRLRKWGLTLRKYRQMLTRQNHCCSICQERFRQEYDACVDHDHSTGVLRDLLCRRCNLMIGQAREDPIILSKGIVYLRRWEKTFAISKKKT